MADQTSGSIDTAARPEAVMAAISDVEQYPAWVESMRSAAILSCRGDRPETVRSVLDHPVAGDHDVPRYASGSGEVSWWLVEAQRRRVEG